MAHAVAPLSQRNFGQTSRPDSWWLTPTAVFLGLGAFVVYATWAALQGANYWWGPYLSPFYSPEIWGTSPHAWLHGPPSWWPGGLVFSPALLILWAPGGMRFTCYYYRGAYYKSFWADPPACTVGEPRKSYLGERHLPLILQNVHRYFMYIAILFIVILTRDAWISFWFTNPTTGGRDFGIGVGSLVLTTNAVLLGGYTFGCHSLRHLVGGRLTQLSRAPTQRTAYRAVSCLNRAHMRWAWLSLFWVAFSDFYVRMLAMGVFHDFRIL